MSSKTMKQKGLGASPDAHVHSIGGLNFANPLDIPMERRLQTMSVIFFIIMFLFTPIICVYYPLKIFFTSTYWWYVMTQIYRTMYRIVVIYACWFYYDRNSPKRGGYVSETFKNWAMFKWLRDYFPISLHKTVELDPSKNYI